MKAKLRLIVGRQDLGCYSDEDIHDACFVQGRAEMQAGLYWPWRGEVNAPWVPAQWTSWLLMFRAGVPCEVIAYLCRENPRHVGKRLAITKALLLFPPYAARIEALMQDMPRYGVTHLPATTPVKEAACDVQAG